MLAGQELRLPARPVLLHVRGNGRPCNPHPACRRGQKKLQKQAHLAVAAAIAVAAILPITQTGYAQSTGTSVGNSVVGGTYPLPKAPLISSAQTADVLRHRDPAGKPCLSVGGYARPYATQAMLYDHIVIATNSCAQAIKVAVCYYKSQQCVTLDVPGRSRREGTLGTMPSIKDFQFEFRERF